MSRTAPRRLLAAGLVAFVCAAACASYLIVRDSRMTALKLRQYVTGTDFARLSTEDRSKSIRDLAARVNQLSLEERRRWWLDGSWRKWFSQMTESEKGEYLDETLPTGVTQVIDEFEGLPQARRQQTIDRAMKQLRDTHRLTFDQEPGQDTGIYGTNTAPVLSADLERRVLAIGLRTYYRESSAQTKAELAPLLEELQHEMQNGPVFN
jgi:hypothetical protein